MCEYEHLSDMTLMDMALKYKDFKWAKKVVKEKPPDKNKARVMKDIVRSDIAYLTLYGLMPVEKTIEELPIVHLKKPSPKAMEVVEYEEISEYEQFVIKDYVVLDTYLKEIEKSLRKMGWG